MIKEGGESVDKCLKRKAGAVEFAEKGESEGVKNALGGTLPHNAVWVRLDSGAERASVDDTKPVSRARSKSRLEAKRID